MKNLNLTNNDIATWEARLDVYLATASTRNQVATDALADTTAPTYCKARKFVPAVCSA